MVCGACVMAPLAFMGLGSSFYLQHTTDLWILSIALTLLSIVMYIHYKTTCKECSYMSEE